MISDFPPQPAPLRFLMSRDKSFRSVSIPAIFAPFDADDVRPTGTPQTRHYVNRRSPAVATAEVPRKEARRLVVRAPWMILNRMGQATPRRHRRDSNGAFGTSRQN